MKRYLIAASGMSPQVITETLYALHMEGRMVDGIRILTTKEGKREINANLLDPEDGQYFRFCKDYGIDPATIDFQPRHVIVVTGEHGIELDDIAQDEENEAFLKLCMETAFEMTSVPENAVYFSIAGGRKTMGACLTTAAQCYGRPQDRIYHVLVTPEFESSREFYYPPLESRMIELKDFKTKQPYMKETKYARITLSPMPFISVREQLSDEMLKGPETPQSLMLSLVRDPQPELVINLKEQTLTWKGREIDMRASWLATYAYFAMVKKDANCTGRNCRRCQECFRQVIDVDQETLVPEVRDGIAQLYKKTETLRELEGMSKTGIKSMDAGNFKSYRKKVNEQLTRGFGGHEIGMLEIGSIGRAPTRYGITLERDRIRIVM